MFRMPRFPARAFGRAAVCLMGSLCTVTLASLAAAQGVNDSGSTVAPPRRVVMPAEAPLKELPYTPSLHLESMDRSADPCDDLYQFACGGWMKNNPVPPDQTSWSVYRKAADDNQRYLWGILEDAARAGEGRTPTQQKIGDYFSACMDTAAIGNAGLAPLQEDLRRIERLKNRRQIAALIGSLHSRLQGGGPFFRSGAVQDSLDASKVIAAIDAGGLGLPNRDYYLKDDTRSRDTRERYVAHITTMFELMGEAPAVAKKNAATVLRIETALAKASMSEVDRRDPHRMYNRHTLASLQKLAPAFDWQAYFTEIGFRTEPWLNVTEPAFFEAMNARIANESLPDLRTYLRWHLINGTAEFLSAGFVETHFAFHRQYLRGAEADRPRWKKCVAWVDRDLGEALGREFVARTFPEAVKERTLTMTREIQEAMKARIEQLDWMSPDTKAQALDKLSKMRNKVGYPEAWRDYSALRIERNDFFGNVMRAAQFETQRQAAKIGKPVDRGEWGMTAPTVNAYYDPSMNDINFPAGVLMPPLYDPKMDDAPNYGNTGGTIGHELTHGFDDSGRQFDGDGNLRDWWTKEDAARFEERAQCIRDQYSQYTIVDDIRINGALTSGEDIADLGGAILAWVAWQEHTKAMRLAEIDGLTPSQRFFVGFAQWACANVRPEEMRVRAITDPHSPPRYRINGVVANMPEFAAAFSCPVGRKLVKKPEDVCRVW